MQGFEPQTAAMLPLMNDHHYPEFNTIALWLEHKLQDLFSSYKRTKTHLSIIILNTVKRGNLQLKCIEDKMCLCFRYIPPQCSVPVLSGNTSLVTHYISAGLKPQQNWYGNLTSGNLFSVVHSCKTWVCNIEGAAKAECVRQQGAEEDI